MTFSTEQRPAATHRRSRIRRAALAVAVCAGMLAPVAAASPANAQVDATPIVFGGSPDRQLGETFIEAVDELEADFGRSVPFVRDFARWGDAFPTTPQLSLRDRGQTMLYSVRGKRADGSTVAWSDIANSQPGDPLYADIVALANGASQFQSPFIFAFHHEPEHEDSIVNGTDQDFIAAFRHMHDVFAAEGAHNAIFSVIMTSHAHNVDATDRRQADKWYPGDDYVDFAAVDAYNWSDCRPGINNPWESLEDNIDAFRVWGQAHPSVGLVVAEFGSVEDPNDVNRKADWFSDVAEMFAEPAFDQFVAASYFNQFDPNPVNAACSWRADTSPESDAAFRAMAASPALSAPTGLPVLVSPAPCAVAENTPGVVTVSWDRIAQSHGYVVYRNGNHLARVDQPTIGIHFDTGLPFGATYSWSVASIRADNTKTTPTECGSLTIGGTPVEVLPPATCSSALATPTSVGLDWDEVPDANGYVVYRNGNWRARVDDPATSDFIDATVTAGTTYSWSVASIRADNSKTVQTACGSVAVPQAGLPAAPATCSSTDLGGGNVRIDWDEVPTGVGYLLYRDGQWLTRINDATVVTYTDGPRPPGTVQWSIRTVDAANARSEPLSCGSVTITSDVEAPATCSVVAAGPSAVDVSWAAGANAAGYIVYRNGNWAGRVNDPNTLTFLDANVPAGVHSWSVASIRPDGSKTAQAACGGL